MKDILTPEQQSDLDKIRNDLRDCNPQDEDGEWAKNHTFKLLSILDSLQPKQYTEQELARDFDELSNKDNDFFGSDEQYDGWIECAKFLGALKENTTEKTMTESDQKIVEEIRKSIEKRGKKEHGQVIKDAVKTSLVHDLEDAQKELRALLRIVDSRALEIEQLKNGKALNSLHNQIVALEVKNQAQALEISEKKRPR